MKGMLLRTLPVMLAALVATAGMAHAGESDMEKIRITVGEQVLTAVLLDNATSRDFLSLLPLTLSMRDFAGKEKVSPELPKPLDTSDAPSGFDPSVGDITYYAPWGNLALFYRDGEYASGLVFMGRFDGGMEAFQGLDKNFEITIERME